MKININRRDAIAVAAATAAVAPAGSAPAQDTQDQQWWGWRGPNGNNHCASGASAPSSISADAIAWSIDLPGRGHSSPIVAGDAIYLTTADKASGTQSVLAISREGKGRWARQVHRGGIPRENHPKNTEASPTIAYDGEALFAAFYNSGGIQLTKLTIDGEIIWQREVGKYNPNQYKYGYAASPLIYRNSVIINADYDGAAFLAAIDRKSGTPLWKIPRPGKISFSSPMVARVAGRDQLLLSGSDMVASYDPASGELLWRVPGATTMATCGTMVWDGDYVFASGGYPESETVCIAGDGSGKVIWSNRTKCYEQSMLAKDGFIFAVADSGVAYCWNAKDGRTMWQQRFGGKYSSSPLLVGDTIIVFNESGNGFSFAASPDRFQSLGRSKIADEVFASPVIVGDTMFLRVANNAGGRQEKLLAMK